jgi:hypothetical protein
MNSKSISLKGKQISLLLLGAFIMLLAVTIIYSELFHAPLEEMDAKKLALNPLKQELLAGITKITIQSPNNLFSLEKDPGTSDFNNDGMDDDTQFPSWYVSEPMINPARPEQIQKLIYFLKNIAPKQAFQYDDINLANLELQNSPNMITIKTASNDETTIKIGIKNQTEKLVFLAIEQKAKKQILGIPLELVNFDILGLSQFLDSRILLGNNSSIEIIELYQGKNLDTDPKAVLLKKDQLWYGPNYDSLNDKEVQKFLTNLFKIKSLFILDKASNETQDTLDKLRESITMTIIIKNKNNNGIAYSFSEPISYFPEVKLDRKAVVVWASNRKHPYLVGKEEVTPLNIKQNDFRD